MKLERTTSTRNQFNVLRSPDGVLIHGPSCPRGILTFGHWVSDFVCACVAATSSAGSDASAPARDASLAGEIRVPRDDQYQARTRQFQPAEPHQLEMEVG